MKKPWEIIQELEATNSRLDKEKILKDNWRNKEFKEGLQLALDSMNTFGIKQIPEKVGGEEENWPEPITWIIDRNANDKDIFQTGDTYLTIHDFRAVCKEFKDRTKTGNAAKDCVDGMIARCESLDEWNYWYRRILLKDLKCGISEKTVNKVYGKGFVPVFSPMLAKDGTNKEDKIKGELIVEYKFDGVRCLGIIENGECTLYTRTGRVINNFPHINKALSKDYYNGYVLDGELMGKDFQLLMKKVNRNFGWREDEMDEYFAVFDLLTIEEFKSGGSDIPQLKRKKKLDKLFRGDADLFWNKSVHSVNYDIVDMDDDVDYGQFVEKAAKAPEQGFEGIMVKPVDGVYKTKRTDAWLKLKPFIEVTLELKDVEEGTGKNAGKLGALICEGIEMGKHIKVNVGSGLSDDDRESIWANPQDYLGLLVEIRADVLSKAEDSDHWSLRFPRFKGFRGSKPGEKI